MAIDTIVAQASAEYLRKLELSAAACEKAAYAIAKNLLAAATGDTPVNTVNRFIVACEDLLSGQAMVFVKEVASRDHSVVETKFSFPGTKLSSERIEPYVKLRKWSGPTAVTIRKRPQMMEYISERRKAFDRPRKPRAGSRAAHVMEIVAQVSDPTDQSTLREALADGAAAKRKLDLASSALSRLGGISYEDLETLDLNSIEPLARSGALSEAEREVMSKFVIRMTDTEFLASFHLELIFNRIMSSMDGSDLVTPEELALFKRLATNGLQGATIS